MPQFPMVVRPGLLALWVTALCLSLAACQEPPRDDAARKAKALALYADYKKDFPEVAETDPQEALALWRDGRAVFVDARSPAEQAVSSLPGAVSEAEYLAKPQDFAGKPVVVYCTIGYRSGQLASRLAAKGRSVSNLAAGIIGWLHAGGSLADAAGAATTRVHVYGRTWDLAPLAYTAVW